MIARDQVRERAHVRAAVARGAAELAIVGHVVAADQDAGGHRAEPDEQQDQRGSHASFVSLLSVGYSSSTHLPPRRASMNWPRS